MFKNSFTKTVVRLSLATGVVYAGGVALSLKNSAFNELFTDNVPLAEDIVDFIQDYDRNPSNYTLQGLKEKLGDFEKVVSIPKTGAIPQKIDEIKQLIKGDDKKEKKQQPQQQPTKTVKPAIQLQTIQLKVEDPELNKIIDDLNLLIHKINSGEFNELNFNDIAATINKIDVHFKNLENDRAEKITKELNSLILVKEKEILESFSKQFSETVKQIENKHDAQLAKEIEQHDKAAEAKYAAIVKQNELNLIEELEKKIKTSVENEREGKYSKFNELNGKLSQLEDLVLKIDDHLSNHELKSNLQFNLNKLKFKLNSSKVGEDLSPEINNLHKLAVESKNEIILNSIDSINSDVLKQGLLTNQQLITRFQLLVPELRSAALLPPNAGVLGHLASKLFSSLLISKKGHVEGSDVESVIARVENYLMTNQLDNAVEEVSNLKGWSKELSHDWLVESRKRLEVEFLVKIIDLESRTLY